MHHFELCSPYVSVIPAEPSSIVNARRQLRRDLLALNRQVAGWLGLDPRFTISTNISFAVARATGLPFTTAKQLFHGGVAGVAAAMIGWFGAPFVIAVGLAPLFYRWLESFDSSNVQF